MSNVLDIAAYISNKMRIKGEPSLTILQGLVYYCQVWHLVWTDEVMFQDTIFAEESGVRINRLVELEPLHISPVPGRANRVTLDHIKSIRQVLRTFRNVDKKELLEEIMGDDPYLLARYRASEESGLEEGVVNYISLNDAKKYYNERYEKVYGHDF